MTKTLMNTDASGASNNVSGGRAAIVRVMERADKHNKTQRGDGEYFDDQSHEPLDPFERELARQWRASKLDGSAGSIEPIKPPQG